MSTIFPAEQLEQAFLPHRLQNWERASDNKLTHAADPRLHTITPRSSTTKFIANNRGWIKKGHNKLNTSFNNQPQVYEDSPARWPETNTSIRHAPSATMGYKGICTTYLPSGTVTIPAVEIQGCKERHYM